MGFKASTWVVFLFCFSAFTEEALSKPFFNVIKYGAKADGRTDIRRALTNAWKDACASHVDSTVLIPKGTYFMGPVLLVGPCRKPIEFRVEGKVVAPMNPDIFKATNWINFQYINGLIVSGRGTFDGKGKIAWTKNDCHRNSHCQQFPYNFKFDFVNNSRVEGITSLNSKNFHMSLFGSHGVRMQSLMIIAPENSPNTDGIHIGSSSFITITDSTIRTGDDCISIGPGSQDITIARVFCGPGHGISIGSLGKYPNEKPIVRVKVKSCILSGTTNGLRIKTWPSSPPGLVSDLTFENIFVNNVYNPVTIDQEYCPHLRCDKSSPSLVKLKNIKFKNIRGTSASNVVVSIVGSKAVPCEVHIGDMNLLYKGRNGPARSICSHANVFLSGKQNPATCRS